MEILIPDFEFDWQDEVKKVSRSDDTDPETTDDIEAALIKGENLSWVGGVFDIPNSDEWVEIFGFSDEYINALMFGQIQSDGNSRFDEYWEEKMRRRKDGIE